MLQLLLQSAGAFLLVWVAWNLHLGLRRRYGPRLDFPVVGTPNDRDYKAALREGYQKYPTSPFIIPTHPPLVILPMSVYLESKQYAGQDFNSESYERFMGRWTGVGTTRGEVVPTIRQDLTKSIASILPLIQNETHYAFDKELGRPQDWKPVPLHATVLRMVALLSGRVFVGYPLNRSEEWLDASINYTTALAGVLRDSMIWNPLLIPFVGGWLPSVRRSIQYLKMAQKWMKPLLAEVLSRETEKTGPVKVGARGTFISWLLKYLPENQRTAERIGMDQMIISFAAIHTTSSTGSMVLLNLAARPQYVQPLREEIEAVLAEDGEELDDEGLPYIRKSSFAKMRKLDSFIRETQRFNSLGLATPPRMTVTDITFSNGLKLPRGTRFSFPTYAINMSNENPTLSPAYNAGTGNLGPEVFDAFRFSKLREVPGRETKHQSVATSMDNLVFGHGPHACPGRFFAIYEVKALVVEMLRNYDLRLAGDVEGKGAEAAPTLNMKMNNLPDPRAMVEIRTRAS